VKLRDTDHWVRITEKVGTDGSRSGSSISSISSSSSSQQVASSIPGHALPG